MSAHPEVEVQLIGRDGNAFAIIGAVTGQLRRSVGHDVADRFAAAAMESDSYDALLRLVQEWVTVV